MGLEFGTADPRLVRCEFCGSLTCKFACDRAVQAGLDWQAERAGEARREREAATREQQAARARKARLDAEAEPDPMERGSAFDSRCFGDGWSAA